VEEPLDHRLGDLAIEEVSGESCEVALRAAVDLGLNDVLATHANEEIAVLPFGDATADTPERQSLGAHGAGNFYRRPDNHRISNMADRSFEMREVLRNSRARVDESNLRRL